MALVAVPMIAVVNIHFVTRGGEMLSRGLSIGACTVQLSGGARAIYTHTGRRSKYRVRNSTIIVGVHAIAPNVPARLP